MACFTVTLAAACGTSIARHIVAKKENKKLLVNNSENTVAKSDRWSNKLKYLELALYGGSILLAGEHVIKGEVKFVPPFLTALSSAEDTREMLIEMGTRGVTMMLAIVLAWFIGVFVVGAYKRKHNKKVIVKE